MAPRILTLTAIIVTMLFMPLAQSMEAKSVSPKDVEAMLHYLDSELRKGDSYKAGRHQRIDSLRMLCKDPSVRRASRMKLMFELGDEYNVFNADSAINAYDEGMAIARSLSDDSATIRFALRKCRVYPLLLFFDESKALMDSVKRAGTPPGLEAEQAEAESQMLFYTAQFFTDYPAVYDSISSKRRRALQQLIDLTDSDSPENKLYQAEEYFYSKEYTRSIILLTGLIAELPDTHPIYARASYRMAEIARLQDDADAYIYYLTLSAIADTRCATLEVASLQELGHELYSRGDIERAHSYMTTALRNAVDCNATLRMIQTSKILPLIDSAHSQQISTSRARMWLTIVALGIIMITLAMTVSMIRKRNLQLAAMAGRLTDAAHTKDVYISQFLNLCSIYMDKLNQFNKVVNRKLTAGKTEDLIKLTKSGKFIEEQSREFYAVFDDAFLHLYPNFVAEVNRLLLPDRQVELTEGEKLNTDLRILALMRLGVDDTSRIAQMLNYSVYTIYTYRNKFKSRAISRDTFEADVMAIKSE